VEVYGLDVMLMQMVWQWCQQFRDGRTNVLDDARTHMAAASVNHIASFRWERLDHTHDFHFFLTLKKTLKRRCFTTNKDVEAAIWPKDTDFYQQGFFKLMKR
jgi:hypothetical protein